MRTSYYCETFYRKCDLVTHDVLFILKQKRCNCDKHVD